MLELMIAFGGAALLIYGAALFATIFGDMNPPPEEEDLSDLIGNEWKDINCPVCGFYCSGKGGHGCIDKPSLVGDWGGRKDA